jgi:uncharacterized membrane protein
MQRSFSILPGFILGAAVAGFFDGVVLHQILQWHHMICIEAHCIDKNVAALQRQTYYDGLFHAGMLLFLLVGLVLLVREANRGHGVPPRRFWGSVLLGGGMFNVLEGIVDHQVLQIHHVRFGPNRPAWDLGFLVLSSVIAIAGFLLTRYGGRGNVVESRPVTAP